MFFSTIWLILQYYKQVKSVIENLFKTNLRYWMRTSISSLNITWYYTTNIELGIYKYVFYKLKVVKLCLEKLNKIRRLLLLGTMNFKW